MTDSYPPPSASGNKIMLITGASGGIGRATARLAAEHGYQLALHYHRHGERADKLCNELEAMGAKAIAMQADIGDEKQVVELFQQIEKRLGKLTVLVNNAGVIAPLARLQDMSAERIEQLFRVNVFGSFYCAREAVRSMSSDKGGEGGSIINISSIASSLGSAGEFIDYAASKGAIDTMTIGLAKEVAEQQIRVNAVRPGIIETEMHIHTGDPKRPERIRPNIPMKRSGTPEEVAETVLWLASDKASYITGALVDVSGGR